MGIAGRRGGDRVYCPYCRHLDTRVIDSRTADDGAARRRRSCPACGRRFTTQETVILTVAKRSGVTEPFNRDKIVRGVRRACQGRPVTEDQLAFLAQQVEDVIRSRGSGEIPSQEIGLAILGPLRDFEEEIASLRAAHLDDWRPDEMEFFASDAGPESGYGSKGPGRTAEARASADVQSGHRGAGQ